jgi:hypothetical protein
VEGFSLRQAVVTTFQAIERLVDREPVDFFIGDVSLGRQPVDCDSE